MFASAEDEGPIDSYIGIIAKSPVCSFDCCSLQSIKHWHRFSDYTR